MLTSSSTPRFPTLCFLIAALFLTACASDSAPPPAKADSATTTESAPEPDAEETPTKPEAEEARSEPAPTEIPAPTAAPATPAAEQMSVSADLDAGKTLYKKKCSTCHGANGEGNAKMAAMLKVTIRPLGSAEVQALSDGDITRIVGEGNGKMKPVTGLSDADLANVIAYVRTLAAP